MAIGSSPRDSTIIGAILSRQARRSVSAGSSPAINNDDLPDPDGPTTGTNRDDAGPGVMTRSTSVSTSRLRPKNTGACLASYGSSSG